MIKNLLFLFLLTPPASAQLTRAEFDQVLQVFDKVVQTTINEHQARLVINQKGNSEMETFWWNLDNAHASYTGYLENDGTITHNIFVFGGYARQPGMTTDGLAWVLCHELGHGLGGSPHKESGAPPYSAVEGQADYYSTQVCLRQILPHLNGIPFMTAPTSFTQTLCDKAFTTIPEQMLCYRQFRYLEQHRQRMNEQQSSSQPPVQFETPDTTQTPEINTHPYYYPGSQCRLDTLVAGVLLLPRPLCWWRP